MKIFYSKNKPGFYIKDVSVVPKDAKEISEQVWQDLLNGQTAGKVIDFSDDPPTIKDRKLEKYDLIVERQQRINIANKYISSRQWPSKIMLGRLNDEEKSEFNRWLDYLDELEAVDTSTAPEITWPNSPAA